MDKRLEQALEVSNFQRILETRQAHLKLLMDNKMKLSYEGGVFKIDMPFITFLSSLLQAKEESFIFIDINDTPILINTLNEFALEVYKKYMDALNQYYMSYQKLNEARDLRKVIDWDEE